MIFSDCADGCAAAQLTLTFLIFFTTIFVLGFVAEPLIAVCMDPWGSIFGMFSFFNWDPTGYYESDYRGYPQEEHDKSWATHFTMGFASLGLLSMAKTMLTSPIQIWIRRSGRRGGTSGRDRLSNLSWLMILVGAATFVYVRSPGSGWSQLTSGRACGRWCVFGAGEPWKRQAEGCWTWRARMKMMTMTIDDCLGTVRSPPNESYALLQDLPVRWYPQPTEIAGPKSVQQP
jgi:hypothetical protein